MRRKIVSLMMVVILLLSGVVFSAAPKSSAASVVMVNKKSVTVKNGKSVKVTFSTKKSLSLSAEVVSGEDNVILTWGKWKTKKKKNCADLKIKGVNPGEARIMISNTWNKTKIYVNVKITGKSFLKCPSLPCVIPTDDEQYDDLTVTRLSPILTGDSLCVYVYTESAKMKIHETFSYFKTMIVGYCVALYDKNGVLCGKESTIATKSEDSSVVIFEGVDKSGEYELRFVDPNE